MKSTLITCFSRTLKILASLLCFFCSHRTLANVVIDTENLSIYSTRHSDLSLQDQPVTGTVIDENGEPLPGVAVLIKGTDNGVITDTNGQFNLDANPGDILVVSFIGYADQEISVDTRSSYEITLSPDLKELNEVVIVGYGTVKKSDLTGSVVNIKSEEINQIVSPSFDNAIQGRLPGVQVSTASGQPGAESGIKIRGGNSISGGNQPLVVIDGVPINNQTASDGVINSAGTNPLSAINPNDIASIEVLKDASAAAIYGARAGNGVILITTKTGRSGRPEISFNTFVGVQSVLDEYDIRNASQYAELVNRISLTDPYTQAEIDALGAGTDYQDAIFRDATTYNVNLGIRGGSENTTYSFSADYFDQEGTIINTGLDRYSFRANIDTKVGKFNFGTRMTYAVTDSDLTISGQAPGQENSGVSPIRNAVFRDPITPIRDANGNFTTISQALGGADDVENPVAILEDGVSRSKLSRYIGNFFAEYEFLEGLKLKSSIGFDLLNRREEYYVPLSSLLGSDGNNNIASVGSRNDDSWINENVLSYSKSFNSSSIDVVLGTAFQGFTGSFTAASAQGFPNDVTKVNLLQAASTFLPPSSSLPEWSIASYFGRVNYSLNNKYLLSVNGRYDGSSRFGQNNKWAFFPSTAVAWKIHEEDFLNTSSQVSQLKLRVSYGRTGNQDIAPFLSLGGLNTQSLVVDGTLATTYYVERVANPDLQWETTDQFNVGIDLGLFEQRIAVVMDYYIKSTKDLLIDRNLPSSSGFRSSLQNIGEIENRGFELGITSYNIENSDFEWSTSINFSTNQSEVLDLGRDVDELLVGFRDNITREQSNILRVGEELGSFYGWIFDGIYQEDQDANSVQPNSLAGDPIFRDVNGDGVLDGDDRTIIGNATPDFIYGIANNFKYKNFDLSIFLQGSHGNDIYNATLVDGSGGRSGIAPVFNEYIENAWTPENPSNTYPRIDEVQLNGWTRTHTGFIEDGSYLRIRNITLGYSLNQGLLDRVGIKSLRVYVSADNLATFTDYSGLNPDVNSRPNDNFNPGLDDWIYPAARNFRVGLNMTF